MTNYSARVEQPKGIPWETFLYRLAVTLFLILIVVKDQLGVSISLNVFTVIWLAIIVFASVERAAAFTVCSTICFASSLSVTIPIAVFTLVAFARGVRKVYMGCFFAAVFLIISEATHFLDAGQDFRTFVNMSMFIVLVLVITTQYLANPYDPVPVLKHYIGFFLFLATDILVFTLRWYGSISAILSEKFRIGQTDILEEGVKIVAMSINANGLGFLALLAVGIALVLLNQKQMRKGMAIAVIVYSSFIGALTISKTFVICYVFLIGIFYLWYMVSHSTHFLPALRIAVVIGILFLIFSFTEVYRNIQYRFESTDLTTGRVDILLDYLQYMNDRPEKWLFGIGMQWMNVKAGFETVPHNGFLEAYVGLGLVGLFSIVYLVLKLIFLYRDKYTFLHGKRPRFLNYIPLFVHMFFIQSFQFIKISYIFVPLALSVLCILVPHAEEMATVSRTALIQTEDQPK